VVKNQAEDLALPGGQFFHFLVEAGPLIQLGRAFLG
jgi:hypothetical protein